MLSLDQYEALSSVNPQQGIQQAIFKQAHPIILQKKRQWNFPKSSHAMYQVNSVLLMTASKTGHEMMSSLPRLPSPNSGVLVIT